MLTYSFEDMQHETLCERLYRLLREDIVSGKLASNEHLPSKRAFAKQLGISTITVENAYAQLIAEGYIYALPRRGYFVADLGEMELIPGGFGAGKDAAGRAHADAGSAAADGQSAEEGNDEEASLEKVIADFNSNQNEPGSFPFSIWAKLSREILRDHQQELMTNPPAQGDERLRCAIADHLGAWRGMHVDPSQIIIGAGTDYLYGILIQLLGFDGIYALEDPGYAKLMKVYRSMGIRALPLPLDEDGLDMQALQSSGARVVHVTPSHHFPTGITMPAGRRYELLRWAAMAPDRYILEDDYDSEFRMNARPLPALYSMDQGRHVIYINTFTKTLASTIRVSYMVLPHPLAQRFRSEMSFYSCSVPMFEQYTIGTFIRQGYFEKHINRMRTANRRKLDLLLNELRSCESAERITIAKEHAGLHFLVNFAIEGSADQFVSDLHAKGVYMTQLKEFYFDPANIRPFAAPGDGKPEHTFLMNYSSVPAERLPEAVAVIDEMIR